MRALLGWCVVALAATACSAWNADKEYHYQTEWKMLHELDKKIHQHAGFTGKSNFILQFQPNTILVKIENAEIHPVNERVDPEHPHVHLSKSIPWEVTALSKPFRINYLHGDLVSIDVAKDDPLWSVNAKKAVAAQFQLRNMNSKNETEKHFYTRLELGAHGECEVDYEIDDSKENELHITKTKDFQRCKSFSFIYYDNQNLQSCFNEDNAVYKPFHDSEITHLVLSGVRDNYIVKKHEVEERFTFAPYGHNADYNKGDAKWKWELTDVVPKTETIEIPDDAVTHHDLHFQFHNAPEIKSADDLKNHPHGFYDFLAMKHSVEKTAELFERLMTVDDHHKYTEAFKTTSMNFLFARLSHAMSTLNYDELNDLFENHVKKEGQPGEDMRVRKSVFGDALIAAGTSSAFMYIKDKMISGIIPHHVISHLMKQIPMSLTHISEPLLEEFYSLCKSEYIHDNVDNRKVCFLAFSTVVHEQCIAKYYKSIKRHNTADNIDCTPEIAEKFFQKFLLEPESHQEDSFSRILFIKVAGNFGTRGSLKELLKIIHNDHIQEYYKFNAIMALKHLASKEVLKAMLPIYFAHDGPQENRIAALFIILISGPEMHHLEAIADNLEHEDDKQIVHYTMTAIEQVSHMERPCLAELVEKCKRVLRYFPRAGMKTHNDFRHSFAWFSDGFNPEFQIGGGTFFNYINSNQSYVPQHFDLKFRDYVGLMVKSPLELGYSGHGLDKLIDNLFGFSKSAVTHTEAVDKEISELNEKLHIDVRKPEPMLADFYVESFGSTVDFVLLNDSTFHKESTDIQQIIEHLHDSDKKSFKRFYTGHQMRFMVPSILSFPFSAVTMELNFAHFRNNEFKFEPSGTVPGAFNVDIDAHVVHDRFMYSGMGSAVTKYPISASAGILEREYCSLPLKLKLGVSLFRGPNLAVKYTPIVPHTRVHRSFTPVTIVHHRDNPEKDNFLPYYKKNELVQAEHNFFHDYLGYGIHFNGSFQPHRKLDSLGSFRKFMIENDLRTKLYYLEHNPLKTAYNYDISLTPASKDPATEVDIEFTFDHWGFDNHSNRSHKPPFHVVKDGHEDYIDSQGDRKARTCLAKVDVVSKGTKERKLHIGLGYTHTFDDRYHQLNFNYDRSPWGHDEKDHFKICYSTSVLFPHVDMQKMNALETVDIDPKIEVATDIHFGKNCENDKKITARGGMVRTAESQKLQDDRDNAHDAPDNWEARKYRQCKKNIEKGHRYSHSCRKYWYRSLKLREYKLDVEFENLDKGDKHRLEHLDTCFKHYLYYYLKEHYNEHPEHDNHKMHIEANFSATTDHVDIRVTKPDETLEFEHVPHPRSIQARSANPYFEFTNKVVKWKFYKLPLCTVEGNHVHTFDGVHYEIPPMDHCYKVIAKDCSEHKLFTILDTKVENNRFHKAIKVFLDGYLIEALPTSADSDIVVRVNGEQIAVTESEPHYHYQTDRLDFTVSYDGLFYKIRSRKYGVIVYYDGNSVVVNLSPYYRGKQCGLCGDFNNNEPHEFLGPHDCYYQNATDFSYSYAIPGDDCHVPAITAPCTPHEQ